MTEGIKESQVEYYFKKRIEEFGGIVRKVKWIGRRGAPDRFAAFLCWNGFVEFKKPGEKLKPHQEREIAALQAVGVEVKVLDSFERVNDFIIKVQRVCRFKETDDLRDLIE